MKRTALTVALCAVLAASAHADTLLLDAIEASSKAGANDVSTPKRGTDMASVEAQHGKPESTRPAVGEPPITRWAYPGYTVYFEHDRVIDVVMHR